MTVQNRKDTAISETAEVAQEGAGAAQHVAGTAGAEARHVIDKAGDQAGNLAGRLGSELKSQAGDQQQRAAEGLRSFSQDLRSLADGSADRGIATHLVEEAARSTAHAAGWLEGRDPAGLLADVKGFARRRPGAFLALAAGAGLLAGRLTRGIARAEHSGQSGTRTRPADGLPGTAAAGGTHSGRPARTGTDPFNDPWADEPTIPPGTPPRTVDPDDRLPLE
jgi:hypothetical protein